MLDREPDLDWFMDHVVVPSGLERRSVGPIVAWEGSWQAEVNALARLDARPALRRALDLAVRQGFVLSRAQARGCGLPDAAVRSLVRRGVWCACSFGVLGVVAVPDPEVADAAARADTDRRGHALAAAAAVLRRGGHVVSGASAAVLHGLPLLRVPATAQLTATEAATAGSRARVLVRSARLETKEVTDWFGAPVTTPARTVVDLARHDRADGLMAADAALRERLITEAALRRVMIRCRGWPGITQARDVLALASPLAESPLESLTRLALHDSGFPAPALQQVIGRYRVDMLWRERKLILEADGKVKYSRDERWREKRRDLRLNRLGYWVERVTWQDVRYQWADYVPRLRALLAAPPPP